MFLICNSIPTWRKKYKTCENSKQPLDAFVHGSFHLTSLSNSSSLDCCKLFHVWRNDCRLAFPLSDEAFWWNSTLTRGLQMCQHWLWPQPCLSLEMSFMMNDNEEGFHAKVSSFPSTIIRGSFIHLFQKKERKKNSLCFEASAFARTETWWTASEAEIWISIYILMINEKCKFNFCSLWSPPRSVSDQPCRALSGSNFAKERKGGNIYLINLQMRKTTKFYFHSVVKLWTMEMACNVMWWQLCLKHCCHDNEQVSKQLLAINYSRPRFNEPFS